MTTANVVNNRNNNNYNYEADRSGDSQTALLLEHKSIVPPTSMRPNLSWKKLSESFRRVISSGRMMTAGSSTTTSQSCLPTVADIDESFTDEEKSRMLLLGKRSNLRRIKSEINEQQQQWLCEGRLRHPCRALRKVNSSSINLFSRNALMNPVNTDDPFATSDSVQIFSDCAERNFPHL
jgi:hypothetical protein